MSGETTASSMASTIARANLYRTELADWLRRRPLPTSESARVGQLIAFGQAFRSRHPEL